VYFCFYNAKLNGESLYEVQLDTLERKPWLEPGTDPADFFNYGFTEVTWKAYARRQVSLRAQNSAGGPPPPPPPPTLAGPVSLATAVDGGGPPAHPPQPPMGMGMPRMPPQPPYPMRACVTFGGFANVAFYAPLPRMAHSPAHVGPDAVVREGKVLQPWSLCLTVLLFLVPFLFFGIGEPACRRRRWG
jgi:hypothetical protein